MAKTEVRSKNIWDGAVTRADVNVGTAGSALIRKILPGTNVTISSTGADAGTGDVTVNFNGSGSTYSYTQAFLYSKASSQTGLMHISAGPGGATNTANNAFGATRGAVINRAATLKTVSITTDATVTASTYQLRVNGTTVKTFTHTGTKTLFNTENWVINAGDELAFNVATVGTASGVQLIKIEVEYTQTVTGLQGPQGNPGVDGYSGFEFLTGTSAPINANGNNGDIYLNNTTGDFYKKALGAWTLQSNLKGPIGSGQLVRITNVASTNSNSSTTGIQMSTFNTSANVINLTPSLFTVASDGITVSQTGTYLVSSTLSYATTSEAILIGSEVTVDGTTWGVRSVSGGMVTSYGISQASAALVEVIQVTAGQKIGIKLYRVGSAGTASMSAGDSNLIIQKVA